MDRTELNYDRSCYKYGPFFAVSTGVLWVDSKLYLHIVQPFGHTTNKVNRI